MVPERMTARSVSHGRQQFVLCFRHGLAKPRGLCWVIISIMEKLLGLGGLGLGWADQLGHGGIQMVTLILKHGSSLV